MNLKTLQNTPPWDWPGDTARKLGQILADPRAKESDRLIAVQLAGSVTVVNDDLTAAITAILRSPTESQPLRARAAIALGPVLEQADIHLEDDPDMVPITPQTFRDIKALLHELYLDESIPGEVRRRIFEASVRAPEIWHQKAIKAAYSSPDRDWMLTAVFSMRYVSGFDEQILKALKSSDAEILYQAVEAASTWAVAPAWPRLVELVSDPGTSKHVLLAAIGGVAAIRPAEARNTLSELADSDDEDIAEAVLEAITMAAAAPGDDDDEEDFEEIKPHWIN